MSDCCKWIFKNFIKQAFGQPVNIFRTSLIKFYLNSQQMSGSFYDITGSAS